MNEAASDPFQITGLTNAAGSTASSATTTCEVFECSSRRGRGCSPRARILAGMLESAGMFAFRRVRLFRVAVHRAGHVNASGNASLVIRPPGSGFPLFSFSRDVGRVTSERGTEVREASPPYRRPPWFENRTAPTIRECSGSLRSARQHPRSHRPRPPIGTRRALPAVQSHGGFARPGACDIVRGGHEVVGDRPHGVLTGAAMCSVGVWVRAGTCSLRTNATAFPSIANGFGSMDSGLVVSV
jgi:hypothetical protein